MFSTYPQPQHVLSIWEFFSINVFTKRALIKMCAESDHELLVVVLLLQSNSEKLAKNSSGSGKPTDVVLSCAKTICFNLYAAHR